MCTWALCEALSGAAHSREELRDTHAQVAVHAVGDNLAAIVVQLDIGEVILGPIILQGHVHARILLDLDVVLSQRQR